MNNKKNKKDYSHSHNLIKSELESKLITLIDAPRADGALEQINFLHGHNKGFVILGAKDIKWNQWAFKAQDFNFNDMQNILGMELDTYVSMNTFHSPKRLISNLHTLDSLWIDFDYYKVDKYKSKTPEQIIDIISKNPIMEKCKPSYWMFSGKGIYAIWLIENAHAKKCLPLWRAIMDTLHKALKEYGADAKANEPARVLRLAGSNHTGTKKKAKIYKQDILNFNPYRYTLAELADKVLPTLPLSLKDWKKLKEDKLKNKKLINKQKKKKKDGKIDSKVVNMFTIHTLNYARMCDLQKIIELREGNCEGCREKILFLYRYWGNCFWADDKKALEEILRLNNMFTEPLSEKEVINATQNASEIANKWSKAFKSYYELEEKQRPSVRAYFEHTGVYVYSNKRLFEELHITQNEMEHLGTIINAREKNRRKDSKKAELRKKARRNEVGLTEREQAKWRTIEVILTCKEKGLTRANMAKELGCSLDNIKKYTRIINKDNITINDIPGSKESDVEINDLIGLDKVNYTELTLIS